VAETLPSLLRATFAAFEIDVACARATAVVHGVAVEDAVMEELGVGRAELGSAKVELAPAEVGTVTTDGDGSRDVAA
jgi:hypothetical protein